MFFKVEQAAEDAATANDLESEAHVIAAGQSVTLFDCMAGLCLMLGHGEPLLPSCFLLLSVIRSFGKKDSVEQKESYN